MLCLLGETTAHKPQVGLSQARRRPPSKTTNQWRIRARFARITVGSITCASKEICRLTNLAAILSVHTSFLQKLVTYRVHATEIIADKKKV